MKPRPALEFVALSIDSLGIAGAVATPCARRRP